MRKPSRREASTPGQSNLLKLGLAAIFLCGVAGAAAAGNATPAPLSSTAPAAAPAAGGDSTGAVKGQDAPDTPAVEVKGFRSALFGMDENDVRAAIAKDFGKTLKLKPIVNGAERTHGLVARVPDALPDGGASDVSYVFGYKSKKLIQVSIVWSKTTDPAVTPEKLVSNADVLKASFIEQGYKADTIVSDAAVRGGILMFRGSDASGRTTALLLEGRTIADKDRKVFEPASLLLLYMSDPKHADVFRLAPGQF